MQVCAEAGLVPLVPAGAAGTLLNKNEGGGGGKGKGQEKTNVIQSTHPGLWARREKKFLLETIRLQADGLGG